MLEGMIASGLPEPLAKAFLAFDVDTAKGYFAVTTNTVETLTGSAPTSVAAFLTRHVTALAA
jgi:NAD(P)H dehydrogenase (quinone)